jgi:autotransporter-associated beta strand protein
LVTPAWGDYHYFTTVPSGTDGVVQELRWPYWNNSYYNTWLSDGWTSSEGVGGYFYSGLALPSAGSQLGVSCLINWSFWPLSNPLTATDMPLPAYTSPTTFAAQTIGEGTVLRAPGNWSVFQTNAWYRLAFRVWQPADGTPHQAFAGQWLRDPSTGNWYHMATVKLPFAASGIDGLMGFQEDFSGGLQPQRTDYRNCYYHQGAQWNSANQFQAYCRGQKENAGLIEGSTAVFYETCSPANTSYVAALTNNGQSMYLTLSNQPPTPTFDPLLINNAAAVLSGTQILVSWQVPATSSPQFAYQLQVFNNPGYTGTPALVFFDRDPEARQKLLNIPGIATPYVQLIVSDIFDNTNAPLQLTPTSANLNSNTNATGLINGLAFSYFESASNFYLDTSGTNWLTMPNMAALTPVFQGAANDLDLTTRRRRNGYAFNYGGFINVPTSGLYTFTLNSDAGSKLYIDGQLVVNWDGRHSPSDLSGWIGLQAGYHVFNVQYFCDTQNNNFSSEFFDTLSLSYEGPSISRRKIPASAYFRLPGAGEPTVTLTAPADGTTVSGATVSLAASVSPNGNTPNKVQFFVGDNYWAQDSAAPFSLSSFLWANPNNAIRARLVYNGTNILDSAPAIVTTTNMALAPWQFAQIFFHNQPDGASIQGNTYSLIGDGVNLLTRQVNGDCTLTGRLLALPGSGPGPDGAAPDGGWQAGIIVRGNTNLTPGFPLGTSSSRFAAVFGTVNSGTHFQDDTMVNGGGAYASSDLGSANRWFQLRRTGDTFVTSVSADGAAWTAVNTNTLSGIGSTVYAGFFTYAQPSHNPNVHWAKFDNFSLAGNIVGPPGVTVTPGADTSYTGRTSAFTAIPSGNAPFSFQWQRNGVPLPGATNAMLVLTSLQPSASGIYSVVVSNAYGTATANATLTVLSPPPAPGQILGTGPIGYWRLNEATGPIAYDSAGSFNGTGEGGIAFGAPGVGAPGFPGFESDNLAAQFNGIDSDIALPPLNLNTNTVTLTGWVKRTGAQVGWSGLIFCRASSTTSGLHFGTANELRYTWNNSPSTYNWNSGLPVPDGAWTFVALAIEPTRAIIYFATNGVLYSATNNVANPAQAFAGTTYFGYDPNSSTRRLNGFLDEVAIFNRALTRTELSQILSASQLAVPSVNLTSPQTGAAFGAPASISINAGVVTNGHTITKVQFFNDSTLLGESTAPPYSFLWSGVPAGAYTLLAQVVYDAGATMSSPPVFVNVIPMPSTPGPINVVALAANLVNVNWPVTANATGYLLFRDGVTITSTGGTNYLDLGRLPGTTYCYSVIATNAFGSSSSSATNCATTPASGNALFWDADSLTPGAQDGNGNWGASATTWWNGVNDVSWSDGSLALFGAGTSTNCQVTFTNDASPTGIVFYANNGGSYSLSSAGGALNLLGIPTLTGNADASLSAFLKGNGFLKTGPGTLTITAANTNTGPVIVAGGKLVATASCWYSPRSIGSGLLTVSNGAVAEFTATHGFGADAGGRSAIINGGTLQFDHENYVSGLTLNGGSIVGSGEFRALSGATYTVSPSASSSFLATPISFYGSPNFNVARGSSAVDLLVTSSAYNTGGFTKSGAGVMCWAGNGAQSGPVTVSGGTLLVTGSLGTNTVTVQNAATLAGVGVITGAVSLASGATLAPGSNSVGTLTTGPEAWSSAAQYVFQLNNPTNSTGWDSVQIGGTLNAQSTAAGPFVIKLVSLTPTNSPGPLTGFDKTISNSWAIASAAGGVLNFAPVKFTVNTALFSNDFSGGNFSVALQGNSLVLNYQPPVPPAFTSVARLGDGNFLLSGTGQPNSSYRVFATTNVALPFAVWQQTASGSFSGVGQFFYTDLLATNFLQRFYRAVTP